MKEGSRVIKCEGRFNELTFNLNTALDLVFPADSRLEGIVTVKALQEATELVSDQLESFDLKDPYFQSNLDILRPNSLHTDEGAYVDLVPLVSRIYKLEDGLLEAYARRLGAKGHLAGILGRWNQGLDLDSELELGQETKRIAIRKEKVSEHEKVKKGREQPIRLSPDRVSLKGYSLKTKFGIGRTDSDVVVPDVPYSIELFDRAGKQALLVGFWYKNNPSAKGNEKDIMVISQIQKPQVARLPGKEQGSQMGVVGMQLAELVAKAMNFGVIQTYSAEKHPMFMQYPERKPKMKGEFRGYYDTSAKALGFDGSRSTFYTKRI